MKRKGKAVGFVQPQKILLAKHSRFLCFASALYPFSILYLSNESDQKTVCVCVYVFGTLFLSRPSLPSLPLCAWRA